MSWFRKKPTAPMRDVRELTLPLASAAAHVVTQDASSLSHFGGSPSLPSAVPWPDRDGVPLAFLARISLSELHRGQPIEWLPSSGALLFFYDVENQPWGFDPKDRGAWAVLHVPDLAFAFSADAAEAEVDHSPLPPRNIGFRRVRTLPSWERDAIEALAFTEAESDEYDKARDEPFEGQPQHQVGGFPSAVQNDSMELECQLASHGLYCGDSSGYEDPRASALRPGAADWRLLFQVSSDDDLEVMWGDCGNIYFWVREQDARAVKFADTWLVLQCA